MQSNKSTVLFEREGRIGRIILNRPEALNAVAQTDVERLAEVVEEVDRIADIRLVTVEGVGRAFSTGIDMKALSQNQIDVLCLARPWDFALRRLETMDKIVLCLMHGYTMGGGLQLALAADIRVTTPGAKLSVPANREGLLPSMATFRLARFIGLGRARRMILLGDTIDGVEAHRIGLADHIVSEEHRDEEFRKLVDEYMKANSEGTRLAKQALLDCFDQSFDQFVVRNFDRIDKAQHSQDFAEAMAAYREKRLPNWR
jgi:enoyl-CoA hydratase/carnithine racemase